jgi:hypothetical protein
MRRYQLFEFLDQSWMPQRLRDAATRYLNAANRITPFPVLWAAVRWPDEIGARRTGTTRETAAGHADGPVSGIDGFYD